MLREFAQRLMRLDRFTESQGPQPSAIFGDAGQLSRYLDLDRPGTRIAMFPIVSHIAPETAMGIATVLAALLEGWRDVRVYRLFVRLPEESDSFKWSIESSQFSPEDWTVEDLDYNISLSGALEFDGAGWKLTLTITDELESDTEESDSLMYSAVSISALLRILPQVAHEVTELLEIKVLSSTYPQFTMSERVDEQTVTDLLSLVFAWERQLILALWGVEWGGEDIIKAHEHLIQKGSSVDVDASGNFGVWCVTISTARAMLPGFTFSNQRLVSRIDDVVNAAEAKDIPYNLLGLALYKIGNAADAYELLETGVNVYPDNPALWLRLATLYWAGGSYFKAIDTYQRAIEEDAVSAALYENYGKHLTSLVNAREDLSEFILIDPDEYDQDRTTWEAIEAFEEAVAESSDAGADALHSQILLLLSIDGGEDRLWPAFEALVEADADGEYVRSVVDAFYTLDDLSEPIKIITKALKQNSNRLDLVVSLAHIYVVNEEFARAKQLLQNVEERTDDPEILADAQRMLLVVSIPDFEMRLQEVTDIVEAGNNISSNQLAFLEDLVERAPNFLDGYLTLAKAYLQSDEADAALEILLDAQKRIADDPNILELLASVLWDADEPQVAFEYLRRGISKYPNHVPLLARAGTYLFEFGELENAKGYLARAEAINPRHPALGRARVAVAQMISRKPEDELPDAQ